MRPHKFAAPLLALLLTLAGGTARAQSAAPSASAPPPAAAPSANSPHGGGGGLPNGMFEPPPDTADADDRLPEGTIEISILDGDNRPVPRTNVTLGVLHQSVAKGESREHKNAATSDAGIVTFDHLEPGSGIAYRVSVAAEGATFAATPFQLPLGKGFKVGLHVYPVTHDINQALVVMQSILYAEMKDDRVQLQQALTVYNFGRVAWVPSDLILGLPENFTALSGTQQMSDIGVDPIEKQGARIRGTFAPGRQDIEFRWQIPYGGEKDVTIRETLPPHIADARVIAAASQQMRLVVEGFPEAQSHNDQQGQHVLVTEKQLRRDDPPLKEIHVELRDIPTPGPARVIATFLSGLGVLVGLGIAIATRQPAKSSARAKAEGKAERAELLAELEDLERAHRAGEIGPKTYDRARREIIDALARSLATRDGRDAPEKNAKA
jgi:hypothetical protein